MILKLRILSKMEKRFKDTIFKIYNQFISLKQRQYNLNPEKQLWLGGGGSLRAAVLGVNDGLVSNLSLVMGVSGATGNGEFILLAGVAGLLAGSFSMAAGEYVSMRSHQEVYGHQIKLKQKEFEESPGLQEKSLTQIYETKGFTSSDSRRIAKQIMTHPRVALNIVLQEGFGLNSEQLGTPWAASASSFLAFMFGAVIPILPYIFKIDNSALVMSAGMSAIALLGVGGGLAIVSGRNFILGSFRMLVIGTLASVVTFSVGNILGVSIAG